MHRKGYSVKLLEVDRPGGILMSNKNVLSDVKK